VLDREDWGGALAPENLRLKAVKCDTWGGWVWINMDPDCEPLLEYLKPASPMLDPFELDKMRYRWRQGSTSPAIGRRRLAPSSKATISSPHTPSFCRAVRAIAGGAAPKGVTRGTAAPACATRKPGPLGA
jgi:hypothetical protein